MQRAHRLRRQGHAHSARSHRQQSACGLHKWLVVCRAEDPQDRSPLELGGRVAEDVLTEQPRHNQGVLRGEGGGCGGVRRVRVGGKVWRVRVGGAEGVEAERSWARRVQWCM